MYDIQYVKHSFASKLFNCKIPIGGDSFFSQFLVIRQLNINDDYLYVYCMKTTPSKRIINSSYIRDIQDICKMHGQFFQLLIKNIDAIENHDIDGGIGLALNKELFIRYMLPNMQEMELGTNP